MLSSADKRIEVLITGDSMLKNIKGWQQQKPDHSTNITVKCFPGCTFMRMGEKIIHRRLNIMGYDHIIYHLGTNGIVTYDMIIMNHISKFNKNQGHETYNRGGRNRKYSTTGSFK